jgi:hypothetical protein
MCFVSVYENGRMTPVEIVLRRGEEEENDGEVNPTNTYFKHLSKYHGVSPCTTTTCQ